MTYSPKLIFLIMLLTIMCFTPIKAFPQSKTQLESLREPGTYKLYNQKNEYQGKAEWREYGRYRLYDSDGKYKGYAEPRSYGQTRVYDKNGRFKSTIKKK